MLSVTPTPRERGDASRTLAQWWGNVADVDPAMSQCSAVFNQLTISVITHPVNLVWTAAAGSMWQTHNICGCRSASLADQMYIERGDISLVGWISRDVGRRRGGGGIPRNKGERYFSVYHENISTVRDNVYYVYKLLYQPRLYPLPLSVSQAIWQHNATNLK